MSQDFDLTDVIEIALDNRLHSVHTQMPGTIVSYNSTRQTASVKPAIYTVINNEDGNRFVIPHPVLPDVPVVFPAGGNFRMTMPVKPGDQCVLHFSELPLRNWRLFGKAGDPGSDERFGMNDAWAVVGKSAYANHWRTATTDSINLGHDDGAQVDISETEVNLGDIVGTDSVATKIDLNQIITALSSAATLLASGSPPTPPNPDGAAALLAFKSALLAIGFPVCSSIVKAAR